MVHKSQPQRKVMGKPRIMAPGEPRLKGDIPRHRQRRDQVELLKDHPHRAAPNGGPPCIVQRCQIDPVHRNGPAARTVQSADQMQKRTFARSGFPGQRQHFACRHIQRDTPQDRQLGRGIDLCHVLQM